jgi:hypothetical protein
VVDDTGFTIPPKLYDFLKYIALVILPAIAALILGLGVLLAWSGAPVVAGIITLTDTFLGAIIGKSASNFKKQDPTVFGDLVVSQDHTGVPTGLRIIGNVANPVFEENAQVVLNVRREQSLQ